MSLGRLGGRTTCAAGPGLEVAASRGGVSTQPAAPVAPLLLVEERRGDFGNHVKCCEVRHVMEGQSLPLASWKQVREWKLQPPGVCGKARQPVAPLPLAAFGPFFENM